MAAFNKECVLYDRYCIECGECNICDLDKNKICDNCCKCIEDDADYTGIDIDDIIMEEDWEELEEYQEKDLEEDLKNQWRYNEPYSVDINKK
ncbi:hypothetical protein [Lutispora saccharofermentans]|uniref:Ferredoxin n=1 Tax=Lutispora saccharofermentans TaxID=3024236 RepID=A0ABT1NF40_9FIRM|nr:hypothetical protein [Lutispora saccharofermentans]MCQ1529890.1 hypothetical protein [Lutispora saccharofermentans]